MSEYNTNRERAQVHRADGKMIGGIVGVLVIDDETGVEYRAPISRIWARGFKVSRGFGEQIALLLSDFNKPDEPEHAPASKPIQPSLFNLSRLVW